MSRFSVVAKRSTSNRLNEESIKKSIDLLIKRSLGNRLSIRWQSRYKFKEIPTNNGYMYELEATFKKTSGKKSDRVIESEKNQIIQRMIEMGQKSYFPQPWVIVLDDAPKLKTSKVAGVIEETVADVSEIGCYKKITKPEEIHISDILLAGSDKEIEELDAFKDIYGRGAQIRLSMSVLNAAFTTAMKRRHNILFYGEPGCAKTSIVNGIKSILGPEAYLELDSTATTKAGIEKLFLDGLKTGIPPVVFIEEIEKTDEAALRVWLSALDERREIRKVNFRKATVRKFDIVCIATANDKEAFDRLFKGGGQKGRGALSSRFTKQIYVPRPDNEIMKRILLRDIKQFGGNPAWVNPCLELACSLKTDDPREILGLLVGGDRLLDGSYQKDIMSIYRAENPN